MKKLFLLLVCFVSVTAILCQQPRLMVPIGHIGGISSVAFSPDGKKILTAGHKDHVIKLWDSGSGKLLRNMTGHSKDVNEAIFSPDGTTIISAGEDSLVKIWDRATGRVLKELKCRGSCRWLDLSSDGQKLLVQTSSSTDQAELWDIPAARRLHTFNGWRVSFSPGDTTIAMIRNNTGEIISAATGKTIRRFNTLPTDEAESIAFSPAGRLISVEYSDKKTYRTKTIFYDITSGKQVFQLKHKILAYSADGKKMFGSFRHYEEADAGMFDAQTGKLLYNLKAEADFQSALFSPDSKKILIKLAYRGSPMILDVESGNTLAFLGDDNTRLMESYVFSADGRQIATQSNPEVADIWDAVTGRLLTQLKGHSEIVKRSEISGNGRQVMTYSYSQLKLWDLYNGRLESTPYTSTSFLQSAAYSRSGNRAVLISYEKDQYVVPRKRKICVIEAKTGDRIYESEGENDIYTRTEATLSEDGRLLLVCEGEKHPYIVDVDSGRTLVSKIGKPGDERGYFTVTGDTVITVSRRSVTVVNRKSRQAIKSLAYTSTWLNFTHYSPRANTLFISPAFADNQLLDIATGRTIKLPMGTQYNVEYASFSPDGKILATVAQDYVLKLWDVATGRAILKIKDEDLVRNAWINGLDISDDGKRVMVSYMNKLRIWDTRSGALLRELTDESRSISQASFFPGSEKLLTASASASQVWDTDSGNLLYNFMAIDSSDYFFQVPAGYYKCTPRAARLLHYVTADLEVIGFDQLDLKYNRPDKVLEAIGQPDTSLVKAYRKAYEKRINKLGVDTTSFRDGYSVPECDFTNRGVIHGEQEEESLVLHIAGRDSLFTLDRFNVWVNDVPVFGQKGIVLRKQNKQAFDTTVTVQLAAGKNHIEASLTNINGAESYRKPLELSLAHSKDFAVKTYFVGIGIDRFRNSTYDLRYSVKDIRDLGDAFSAKYGNKLFMDTIFNEKLTIGEIRRLKETLKRTSINDRVIVAFSGHGLLSDNLDYYLATYNVNFEKPDEEGLPYEELENLLDEIPARQKLMLIDACHSGEVDKEEMQAIDAKALALGLAKGLKPKATATADTKHLGLNNSFELMQSLFVNVGRNTGATVISAAAGNQFALEGVNKMPNGVFTSSLLEALRQRDAMRISELKSWVTRRVMELTQGLQRPTSRNEVRVDWWVW